MTGGAVEKATGEGEGLTVVSTAPLPPVYVLITYGLWAHDEPPRDTSTDVTDEQIAEWL